MAEGRAGRVGISIHAPRTGSDLPVQDEPTNGNYFNPRSPHGERPHYAHPPLNLLIFQSTLPARGATSHIHSSLRREVVFQSTLPARGATSWYHPSHGQKQISIHAPRTGSDMADLFGDWVPDISIHAPRTGSDVEADKTTIAVGISIHAPRTGSDMTLLACLKPL